jgi:hypothetical protein
MAKFNLRQGNWNNLRVYRNAERSASDNGAALGGWEPANGYGMFNMADLLAEVERPALIGGAEGIVYFGGTAIANTSVRAQVLDGTGNPTGPEIVTATNSNGFYRFDGMAPGKYQIRTFPFGSPKIARVNIVAGCDKSGVDFYCGPAVVDTTPPVAVRCLVTEASESGITVDHWAYDTETRLFDTTFEIKLQGGTTVIPETRIYPEGRIEQFPASLASGNYLLVARYRNGEDMVTTCNVPFVVGSSMANVSGTLGLQSYTGTIARNFTLELRNPGTTTVVESHNFSAINNGAFTIATTQRGTFDVAIKGAHFLRGVIPNVNITNAGVSGLSLSLFNGDVNGDNTVANIDLNQLRASFGSNSSSGNWNPMADLNGDGSVGSVDINILRSNFGRNGTP